MSTYTYSYTIAKPQPDPVIDNTSYTDFQDRVIDVVSNMFGIDPQSLYMKDKTARVKYSRWIIWEIMYACKGFSLKDVGQIFGNFDHTTVMNAFDKLPEDIGKIDWLRFTWENTVNKLAIDLELIRKVRRDRLAKKSKSKFILNKKYLKQKVKGARKIAI